MRTTFLRHTVGAILFGFAAILLASPSAAQTMPKRPAMDEVCANAVRMGASGASPYERGRANMSVARLSEHLQTYPNGPCASDVRAMLAYRKALFAAHSAIAAPGPRDAKWKNTGPVLSLDDWSSRELNNEEQAVVNVSLTVANDGVVETCKVVSATGSPNLIGKTCGLLLLRLTADPARDGKGQPIASTVTDTVRWTL